MEARGEALCLAGEVDQLQAALAAVLTGGPPSERGERSTSTLGCSSRRSGAATPVRATKALPAAPAPVPAPQQPQEQDLGQEQGPARSSSTPGPASSWGQAASASELSEALERDDVVECASAAASPRIAAFYLGDEEQGMREEHDAGRGSRWDAAEGAPAAAAQQESSEWQGQQQQQQQQVNVMTAEERRQQLAVVLQAEVRREAEREAALAALPEGSRHRRRLLAQFMAERARAAVIMQQLAQ